MDFPKYKSKKAPQRIRRTHLHHIPDCAILCLCEECTCRNVPLDQMDSDEE